MFEIRSTRLMGLSDFLTIYTRFNWVEGCLWLVVAILLPFLFKHPTRAKKFAIGAGSLGFIAFGVSDFIEASLPGDIPWWLWALKIACGVVILGSRFAYVGWDRFRFTDRYFLFGLFCLIAVAVIVVIQW